jgi:hypothetical protein
MANPWDRPSIPISFNGDADVDILFACVGRVITYWESIEFELGLLHTYLGGIPEDQSLMREYGEGRIFRERAQALAKKAEEYAIRHCCQHREGDFDRIMDLCLKFADRRNDIAHGILFRVDQIMFFRMRISPKHRNREHFAIIPPLYAHRWHSTGFPDFAYTSDEISLLVVHLEGLLETIRKYRKTL